MHLLPGKNFLFCIVVILSWFVSSACAAPAPPFKVETSKGSVSLEELRGKVIYLDFWATWCGPCRKSFPWMKKIQEKYGDQGLVVLAMNLDTNRANVDRFLKKFQADFTIGFDPDGKVAQAYQVKGMPSSFVIDRDGNIHSSHIGFRKKDAEKLESTIQSQLTKDSSAQ